MDKFIDRFMLGVLAIVMSCGAVLTVTITIKFMHFLITGN